MFWLFILFCLFKQKTAYEMRISDWSSDVCSSDLVQTMAWTRSEYRALILHYRALPPQNARTHINPPFATRQRAQTVSQRCRPHLHSGRSIRPWIDRRFQFRSFRKRHLQLRFDLAKFDRIGDAAKLGAQFLDMLFDCHDFLDRKST